MQTFLNFHRNPFHLLFLPPPNLPCPLIGGRMSFTAEDERLFTDYLAFAGIGLMNAQLFEMSILENKRSKILLNMAR